MTQPLVNDTSAANAAALDANLNPAARVKRRRAKRKRMSPEMASLKALVMSGTMTPEDAQKAKKNISQINKLVTQMMRGEADGDGDKGNAAPNARKLDPSAQRAIAMFGQAIKQPVVTGFDDKDVLETGPDRVNDTARFLGQVHSLAAHGATSKLTAEQERRVATDPTSAGVILPPGSMPVGTQAQYKNLHLRFTKGIVAMVAAGAFKNNGQNFNWDKFIGTGSSPQQKVLQQASKVLAPAISNGVFTNPDGAGFNWGAFFVMMAIMNLKWEGKFLREEAILRLLQGRIAVDGDKVNLEFQKVQNQIGREDSEQQLASVQPAGESNANDMMQRLSSSSSVLDESRLDIPGSLQNSQHRGPVADQMMQDMISKMATGKGLPMLSTSTGGMETEEMLATHHVDLKNDVQGYAQDQDNEHALAKVSVEELAERVLCQTYPGGKRVTRTVLTPEEIARLSPKNKETYKRAYEKNLNMRLNDWYGRAGQILLEREALLSASKDARREAVRLAQEGDMDKANICNKFADAFAIKASRFSEWHDSGSKASAAAPTPQVARSSSDTPPDNAPGDGATNHHDTPPGGGTNNGATGNHNTPPPESPGSLSDKDKQDPYVGKFNEALRTATRMIRPNEEAANNAHRQITFMSYISKQLDERISKLPLDVTVRDKSYVPKTQEEKDALAEELRKEGVIDAQRTMLRNTGIGLALRQIGLGNLLGKSNQHFRTGNMQDPWELGQLRLTQARKAYAEAKRGGIEQQIKVKRRELRNAHVYLKHFESLTNDTHLGTVRIHSAMTHAFAKGQQDVFKARLQAALDGPVDPEKIKLSPGEQLRERGLPKHEQLPSVEEMRAMLKGVSREDLFKHQHQRERFMKDKRSEYAIQLQQLKTNTPNKTDQIESLERAIANIDQEAEQRAAMTDLIKTIGRGAEPKVKHALWNRNDTKGLQKGVRTTANMIADSMRLMGKNPVASEVAEEAGTPFFGTMLAKDNKGAKGTSETAGTENGRDAQQVPSYEAEDDVDLNEADYNDQDDVFSLLQTRARAVNDLHGDLNLDGCTTGAYENSYMKKLIAWDQNVRQLDLAALPQQSQNDLENSSQTVADVFNQAIQAMVQAMEQGNQKAEDMADQFIKFGLPIPTPA